MYESPIEVIYQNVQAQFEDAVLKAVQKVGINVDRDELVKALAYDRGQYARGYADRDAEIVRCKECKYHQDEEPAMVYCPHIFGGWASEDFFCAEGKRREDEN